MRLEIKLSRKLKFIELTIHYDIYRNATHQFNALKDFHGIPIHVMLNKLSYYTANV